MHSQVHNKELKPPPELVDAIQESGDMTAPPTSEAAAPIGGHNVPRAIRNRLAHEEPQQMTEEQREALEERAAGGCGGGMRTCVHVMHNCFTGLLVMHGEAPHA